MRRGVEVEGFNLATACYALRCKHPKLSRWARIDMSTVLKFYERLKMRSAVQLLLWLTSSAAAADIPRWFAQRVDHFRDEPAMCVPPVSCILLQSLLSI